MMTWSDWIFILSGIFGVIVLAVMGRQHVKLPPGFGRHGSSTIWRPPEES